MFRFAGFELDEQRSEVCRSDGAVVKLRPKAYELLKFFVSNPGRILSKQDLIETVWPNVHVSEDSLFQCVREVRSALGDNQRQLIKTVSGRGYLFEAVPLEDVDQTPAQVPINEEEMPLNEEVLVNEEMLAEPPATVTKSDEAQETATKTRRSIAYALAIAAVGAIIGFAVATPKFPKLQRETLNIAVMPIGDADADPASSAMATQVAESVADGLAKIEYVRIVTPLNHVGVSATPFATAGSASSDYVLSGDLRKAEHTWILNARMTAAKTSEVRWATTVSIAVDTDDIQLQETRLAAGLGYSLALHLNAFQYADANDADSNKSNAKVAVEQALASINQTSRERFAIAQSILEKTRAKYPDNIDIEVALAALQLRGIQMSWYNAADGAAAETNARAVLDHSLHLAPNYLPVLDTYCRFLTATNKFIDSLVACAKVLDNNPWDGVALFNLGTTQVQLGRFEDALATYQRAERFDTPSVSRWTWALGLGWTYTLMGRNEDALPWLQRSLAITPGTGRTHLLLAVVFHELGREDEAKAALTAALALRPDSTTENIRLPAENASPLFLAKTERLARIEAEVGLPEH